MEEKVKKEIDFITSFIKKVTEHDFDVLRDDYDSSGLVYLTELYKYIKTLATGYHDSISRGEEFIIQSAREKDNFEAIVDNINGAVAIYKEKYIYANFAALNLFGYSEDEMYDLNAWDIFDKDNIPVIKEAIEKRVAGEIFQRRYTVKLYKKGGESFWSDIYSTTIFYNNNWVGLSIFQDVTDRIEIDKMKTDFISTVSHELRTPLTSILGFGNIIRKKFSETIVPVLDMGNKKISRVSGQIQSNLDIITSEGKRLTSLINDVLDISKMEAGKIDWKDAPFNINEAVNQAISAITSLTEQKSLTVSSETENDIPLVTADKDRIIQVIINFLSNALKFTEHGKIICKTTFKDNSVMVSVKDNGIGISRENLGKVFDKFIQVGDVITNKPHGSGLGLAICKQIIEHYGGTIGVDSEIGKGSTFYFNIPLNRGSAVDLPAETDRVGKISFDKLVSQLRINLDTENENDAVPGAKTILIVDDDPSIRELLKQELMLAGYNTDEASDGIEALNKIRQKKYNLIILDVMMPGLNGFDVAASLKNDPGTMNIPILIYSVLEDKGRGLKIGVDQYLTKGTDIQELIKEVDKFALQASSRRKVMIIDQDESLIKSLSNIMEAKGFNVLGISSGINNECLHNLILEKPNMVIIDEFVPNKENIINAIKSEKGLENLIILVLMRKNS